MYIDMYIHVDMVEQQQPTLLHVRVDSIQETCLKTLSCLPGNVRRRESVQLLYHYVRKRERDTHTHTHYTCKLGEKGNMILVPVFFTRNCLKRGKIDRYRYSCDNLSEYQYPNSLSTS